jgi:hypothetical protein
MALDWLYRYQREVDDPRLKIAGNNKRLVRDLESVGINCVLMPNIYPIKEIALVEKCSKYSLHVGSFGAIRPLKNQLIQAMAAINYADKHHKTLFFHINADRTEQKGESVLQNIRALFYNSIHKLIEHPWMKHDEFLEVLKEMDVALQVSFTETFNIVAADCVCANVEIVTSNEISWLPFYVYAKTNDIKSIEKQIGRVMLMDKFFHVGNAINKMYLRKYNRKMEKIWFDTLRENC